MVPDTPTQFGAELATFNGSVYFVANDDVHGNELWRTDGTNEGTGLVSDLYPGLPNTNATPHRLTVVGDRLFFNAQNAADASSETVFYIDAGQPTTVKQPNALGVDNVSRPAVGPIFGAPNDRVVISRLLGESQNCCYAAYALAPGGTTFTKISAGAEDVGTNNVFSPSATAGGWTYYARSNTNVSPGQGAELWRTNGVGTEEVANIYPGNPGSSPNGFVATSDKVFFVADNGTNGRELWVTDPANKADTHLVHEHVPGTASTSIGDPGMVANGNVLYYTPANDPVTGSEVWRTDGTEAGTRVVKDITPGPGGQSGPGIFPLKGGIGVLRGSDVFSALDGTDASTTLLATASGDGIGPNSPLSKGAVAYFVAGFTPFGQVLWRTDGTSAGTGALTAGGFDGIGATSGGPSAQSLAVLGDKLIFFGRDQTATSDVKLYVVDTSLPDELRQNTTAPTITGTPAAGQVLTADKGVWTRENTFTYAWLRNGTPIPNATGLSYTVAAADAGAQLTFRVTAVGIGFPNTVTAVSAPAGAAPAPGPGATTPPATTKALTVTRKGKLTGKARVGATIKVTLPKLAQKGVKITFRWTANGKAIKKQTRAKLKLTKALKGKRIAVKLTVKKAGFTTRTITLKLPGKVKGR